MSHPWTTYLFTYWVKQDLEFRPESRLVSWWEHRQCGVRCIFHNHILWVLPLRDTHYIYLGPSTYVTEEVYVTIEVRFHSEPDCLTVTIPTKTPVYIEGGGCRGRPRFLGPLLSVSFTLPYQWSYPHLRVVDPRVTESELEVSFGHLITTDARWSDGKGKVSMSKELVLRVYQFEGTQWVSP